MLPVHQSLFVLNRAVKIEAAVWRNSYTLYSVTVW